MPNGVHRTNQDSGVSEEVRQSFEVRCGLSGGDGFGTSALGHRQLPRHFISVVDVEVADGLPDPLEILLTLQRILGVEPTHLLEPCDAEKYEQSQSANNHAQLDHRERAFVNRER